LVDDHGVAADELALQDLFGQRVLDLLLDRALERPRAVHRVEAGLAELVERASSSSSDVALRQPLAQVPELDRAMPRICFRPSGWNTTIRRCG
jgi:hypothetical protein